MSVRINARLEGELARKLSYLRERTAQSTTEVIRTAIEAYFEQVAGAAGPGVLLRDFVGCASGSPDLAERYKAELGGSWSSKLSVEAASDGKKGKSVVRRGRAPR
jgi:hypothetical protein